MTLRHAAVTIHRRTSVRGAPSSPRPATLVMAPTEWADAPSIATTLRTPTAATRVASHGYVDFDVIDSVHVRDDAGLDA